MCGNTNTDIEQVWAETEKNVLYALLGSDRCANVNTIIGISQ